MKNILIMVFILSCLSSLSGQDRIKLEFTFNGLASQEVVLLSYYGDQQIPVDTVTSNEEGYFYFLVDPRKEPGIYYIKAGQDKGIDIIYSSGPFSIRMSRSLSPDSAVVENSLENSILFDYLSKKMYFERRLELLTPVVYYYPDEDPFYDDVEKQYEKLKDQYREYLDEIYSDHPDLIVTRFIRFDQLENIRPGEISPQRAAYLKQHYFDGIDLTDTLLLYSPLLPGRIIDYLSLYVSPGVGQVKQEELFKQAIDSLMMFTLPGNPVREVVANYLIEGFQAYGLEDVMTYLVENYVLDQSCVSEQREEILKKRIEGFKKLAVGNTAPDFEAADISGDRVKLSALAWDYRILFFWSSDCPHCADAIPGLKEIMARFREKAGIVAISVDSDETAWKKAVADKGMDWINIAELRGWDGPVVSEYYVYATPTFLVVDKDLVIVAKPASIRDLKLFLEKRLD